jgi:pilus assembly protein TadC
VQDRIDELADVLKAGNGVEASAARVADEELGATGECRRQNEECRMGSRPEIDWYFEMENSRYR